MTRRSIGSGGICYIKASGLWAGSRCYGRTDAGRRITRRVYSTTFCGMLVKFSQLAPPEPADPRLTRAEMLKNARSLGTHQAWEWWAKVRKQDGKCYYCGETEYRSAVVRGRHVMEPQILTKDHMTPISRGGSDGIDNIVGACLRCNKRKYNKTADEYFEMLDAQG